LALAQEVNNLIKDDVKVHRGPSYPSNCKFAD